MLIQQEDDYRPIGAVGASAEPFMKPDYRAKKHSRPVRTKHKPRRIRMMWEG